MGQLQLGDRSRNIAGDGDRDAVTAIGNGNDGSTVGNGSNQAGSIHGGHSSIAGRICIGNDVGGILRQSLDAQLCFLGQVGEAQAAVRIANQLNTGARNGLNNGGRGRAATAGIGLIGALDQSHGNKHTNRHDGQQQNTDDDDHSHIGRGALFFIFLGAGSSRADGTIFSVTGPGELTALSGLLLCICFDDGLGCFGLGGATDGALSFGLGIGGATDVTYDLTHL